MKKFMDVEFYSREEAERNFNEEGMEIGMAGRIAWLLIMLIAYVFLYVPLIVIRAILELYSALVLCVLFATNPLVKRQDSKEEESP